MTKPDPDRETPWPDEKVALLRKLVAEGRSGGEIGRALGKSRCAVLGKISRLEIAGGKIERRGATLKQGSAPAKGVAARPAPSMPAVKASQTSPVAGVPLARRGRPAYSKMFGPVVTKPLPEPVPFVTVARIGLLQLNSQTCKWPIGDPQAAGFGFCGHAPRENSPYCEYHARAAYVPLQDKRHRVFG